MQVLMVIGQFHPVVGGAQRQCLKLAKALQALGHGVRVVTVWTHRNVPRWDTVEGIDVERIWYPEFYLFGHRFGLGKLAPVFMFVALLHQISRFDVVHVHQALWPLVSAVAVARIANKPVVCKIGNSGSLYDLDVLRRTHWFGPLASPFLKRWVTKFIWISEAVHEDLTRDGIRDKQREHIPNGVEIQVQERRGHPSDPRLRFVFTGTFTLKKNLVRLIQSVALLPEMYRSRIEIVLIGDGPDRGLLQQEVQTAGLDAIIELRGPVDDVTPELLSGDVFILPSATEGLSNSALEAMACGLPVILSDRGGNRDLVFGGSTGILIDPESAYSIMRALIFMIDRPEERQKMGHAARELMQEKYSMHHVARKYSALYKLVTRQ